MLMKFLIICFSFVSMASVLAQNSSTTAIDCKNKRTNKELDAIFAKMYTFGNSGRNFPLNSNEALLYCNETSQLIKRADLYVKNCLKEYPKQLFSILIRTVKSQSKTLCAKTDSRRMQELFTSADCTNAAKDGYQKCINDSIDTLIGIKSVEDKQKLKLLCCGNHKMLKCIHDETIQTNPCNEEKVETSLRFLDSIQGNMISVLCTKFDDSSDTCDKLTYPRKSKKQKRNMSIVLPMIGVLDSIKDVKARGL